MPEKASIGIQSATSYWVSMDNLIITSSLFIRIFSNKINDYVLAVLAENADIKKKEKINLFLQ